MDQRVEVYGTSRHDINGKCGIATDFHSYPDDHSRDRYSVRFDTGDGYKIKPSNVRAEGLQAAAPLLDQPVILGGDGLRDELRGERGKAVDFKDLQYVVQLESGERVHVRPNQFRAEGPTRAAPLLDQRVILRGQGGIPDVLENQRGQCVDFFQIDAVWHYAVLLDTGERCNVWPSHVVSAGASGGTRNNKGKGKAKGKKGRRGGK